MIYSLFLKTIELSFLFKKSIFENTDIKDVKMDSLSCENNCYVLIVT